IDQEDSAAAFVGEELGALFEQAGLRGGDLAGRGVGGGGNGVGGGGEEGRGFVGLFGGGVFAGGGGFGGVGGGGGIALDEFAVSEEACAEAAGEGGFADAFGAGEEEGLREAVLREHLLEGLGDVRVAPEVFKHKCSRSARRRARWRRFPGGRRRL